MTKTAFILLYLLTTPSHEVKYLFGVYPNALTCFMQQAKAEEVTAGSVANGGKVHKIMSCTEVPLTYPKKGSKA